VIGKHKVVIGEALRLIINQLFSKGGGNMKVFKILCLCVLFLVATSTGAWAGGNAPGTVSPAMSTFVHVMYPGDSFVDFPVLEDLMQNGDLDIYLLYLVGSGTVGLTITDCCILGDTMLGLGKIWDVSGEQVVYDYATSPDNFTLSGNINTFGIFLALVGYVDCPGGFPAGYDYLAAFN
jgi:hypothetical protein